MEKNPYQVPEGMEQVPAGNAEESGNYLIGGWGSLLAIGLVGGLLNAVGSWWFWNLSLVEVQFPPFLEFAIVLIPFAPSAAAWVLSFGILIALLRPLTDLSRKIGVALSVLFAAYLMFVPLCSGGVVVFAGGIDGLEGSAAGYRAGFVSFVTQAVMFPMVGSYFVDASNSSTDVNEH